MQTLKFLSAPVKFTEFLMPFMKPQVIFPSKFASVVSIMTQKSALYFNPNILCFGQILSLLSVVSKFVKLPMLFFKSQVSCSSNFVSCFNVMAYNSSVLFWLKHYILSTKEAHQSFRLSTAPMKIEQIPFVIFFKPGVSFLLIFASPFNVMMYNSSEIF